MTRDVDVVPSVVSLVERIGKERDGIFIVTWFRVSALDRVGPAGEPAEREIVAERRGDPGDRLRRFFAQMTLRSGGNHLVARDRPEFTGEQSGSRPAQRRLADEHGRR